MKFRQGKQSKPIPVLLDKALRDRIEEVSRRMGEPKSTVMRIAMRVGLDGLEKAFESAHQQTLSSLSYPEHRAERVEMNEEKASSDLKEDFPAQQVPLRPEKFGGGGAGGSKRKNPRPK